ncbi:hypothetical protein GCM10028807_62090 [Spirosoma daeguense]
MGVHYVISWYCKDTNILLGEVAAAPVPYPDLQWVFALSTNEVPLYDSHLISQQQAQVLSTWLPIQFDFAQHIYQLDCFPMANISSERLVPPVYTD